jgi:8-oxo-dGTP pyrophosphatase MutT (NUDIX family)
LRKIQEKTLKEKDMADYVKEMRKIIGPKPLLICGASVILFDQKQRVLMLLRSDNDCWCFPGGSTDLGEELEQSAKREVYEETGLNVLHLELFHVFSGEELHYIYPHGDEVYIIDVVYTSSQYEGEIRLNDESKTYQFFEVHQIPDNISPPVIPIVRELKRRMAIEP